MTPFDLVEPRSLREAAALLDTGEPSVRAIAGGTAFMLMMKMGVLVRRASSACAQSSRNISTSTDADGALHIGAMATLSALEPLAAVRGSRPGHHADAAHAVERARAQRRDARRASRPCRSAHGSAAGPDRAGRKRLGVDATGARQLPARRALYRLFRDDARARRADRRGDRSVPRMRGARPISNARRARPTIGRRSGWRSRSIPTERACASARIVVSAATDRPTRLAAAEQTLEGARLTMRPSRGRARPPPRRRRSSPTSTDRRPTSGSCCAFTWDARARGARRPT